MREPTPEQFLKDVAAHELTVKIDSEIYRHMRFQQPKSSNMWFDIVTWPGVLTIHGDMGTWTFSRVPDMFTFFRSRPGHFDINASYWAEKLCHGTHGGRVGAKVWDEESFKRRLSEQLSGYYGLEGNDLKIAQEALEDEVLNQDCKYDLMIAARDFRCELPSRKRPFQFDSCELPDGMEYAYHFIWCLYAIVWAIQRYDALKIVMPVEAIA